MAGGSEINVEDTHCAARADKNWESRKRSRRRLRKRRIKCATRKKQFRGSVCDAAALRDIHDEGYVRLRLIIRQLPGNPELCSCIITAWPAGGG